MVALADAHLKITVDSTAFQEALAQTNDAVTAVLRRKYLADGCPNGATPEGFSAWMAQGEAQITATFEQVAPSIADTVHERVRKKPRRFRAPPGSAEDCEYCHPELGVEVPPSL